MTLQLEVGKTYVDKNGDKVLISRLATKEELFDDDLEYIGHNEEHGRDSWGSDGRFFSSNETSSLNLVEEYIPEGSLLFGHDIEIYREPMGIKIRTGQCLTAREQLILDNESDAAEKTGVDAILEERGKNYGHPKDHFALTRNNFVLWEQRRKESIEANGDLPEEDAFQWGVNMIIDKLSRMAENPMHEDNLDDIIGYARCLKRVLGMEE